MTRKPGWRRVDWLQAERFFSCRALQVHGGQRIKAAFVPQPLRVQLVDCRIAGRLVGYSLREEGESR